MMPVFSAAALKHTKLSGPAQGFFLLEHSFVALKTPRLVARPGFLEHKSLYWFAMQVCIYVTKPDGLDLKVWMDLDVHSPKKDEF